MGPGPKSMSLNNSFNLYTVRKLAANGSNWVTYKTRIVTVIGAKGLMCHLRGTAKEPKEPLSSLDKDKKDIDPTTEQLDDYKEKWDKWLQQGYTIKQQIFSTITESLLLRARSRSCAQTIILSSLPADYDPVLSAMLSAARITGKTIPPMTIISHINEEFDRHAIKARLDKVDTALIKGSRKEGQGPDRKGKSSRKDKDSDGKGTANVAATLETHFAFSALAATTPKLALTRCIDTGASHHYSPFRSEFLNFHQITPKPIIAADKHVFFATGRGDVIITFPNGGTVTRITLKDVLYMPSIVFTLISISCIDTSGFLTMFCDGHCQICSPAGRIITCIPCDNNLYKFTSPADVLTAHALASIAAIDDHSTNLTLSATDLHRRLGHMSIDTTKSLIKQGAITGINLDDLIQKMELCQACVQAKIWHVPFPKECSWPRSTIYGELVSSDLFGPTHVASLAGHRYAMTLLDDATYEVLISFLQHKSKAFDKYVNYEKFVQVHRGVSVIQTFRSDRGGEYTSLAFEDHLAKQGMHHEKTVHGSSSQNGAAERFFCMSVTYAPEEWVAIDGDDAALRDTPAMDRTVPEDAQLPSDCMPPTAAEQAPHDAPADAPPDAMNMPATRQSEPPPATGQTTALQTPPPGNGSTTGLPRTPPLPHGMHIVQHMLDFMAPGSTSKGEGEGDAAFSECVDSDEEEEFLLCLSKDGVEWGLAAMPATSDEPHTVNAAKVREDWPKWEAAISDKLERLEKMGMWELTEKPAGANIVSSKWVFKIKHDAAGAISKYKARLVAQGFSQIPGIDFTDTFAPVAKLSSVRLVATLAARFNYELHQMDVKNTYLNGDLKEEIYMKQPPGFPAPGQENKVCHLFKPIYGLKQAGRCWYKKLCAAFLDMGFTQSSVDHSVFFRHGKNGDIVIIAVLVDDLAIATNSVEVMTHVKDGLKSRFDMTNLGELHWLLGIEIRCNWGARTLSMSQIPVGPAPI
ncbi:hypothetical protein EWM64_g7826 [Hericium alpestre]|uniref:Integrase catalytic domain-containing protein n=1 Tax=Hericium alpestre TaxID=135208 RepID=A0A4Y9ZQ52_9AGAM|nr:hypothetical protein EWM64_g7826 [Hericium alpestre]